MNSASQEELRDYFAAHALTGLLAADSEDHGQYFDVYEDGKTGKETCAAKSYTHGPDGSAPNKLLYTAAQNVARHSYKLADAMLAARTQRP